MTLSGYLERHGIDPDEEITELSRGEAVERAVEQAYYNSCISDSTRSGVDRTRKVDTISEIVKSWPQFDHTDFEELDEKTTELIEERRA